uniref:Arrestin_C domain-containing protein n=1 Tax=Trichuris muris TaxID=70415 RepID=A0A5S6QYY6_TRIMR
MIEELRIEYDHSPPIYFPGKSLKGRLVIVMSKPCCVDAVQMFCLGEAFTRKVEAKNKISIGKFVLNAYSAREQFFHLFTELVSPDSSPMANGKVDKLFLQQPGEHSFPFEFCLPADCPQSFESNSGSIRYCCTAEVHRREADVGDDGSVKKVTKRLFTILNGIDLNVQARQESFCSEIQFSDRSCRHFICRLQVPNVRVVPGEYVSTKLKVIHVGKKEQVKEIVAQFVQKTTYVGYKTETKEPTFWEERRVLLQNETKQKPDEKNGTTTTLQWDAVQVPPTAPTIDCGCSLVRVHYEMLYHVITAKNQQQTFVVPLVVGIVPPRKRWPLFLANRNVDQTSEARRQVIEPLLNNYEDMPFPDVQEQHVAAQDVRSERELNHLPDPIYFKPHTIVYCQHTADAAEAKQNATGGGVFSLRWRKAQSIPAIVTAEYR